MRQIRGRSAGVSIFLLAILAAGPAGACPGQPSVWDLELGMPATSLPSDFVEHACGTNGGPPSLPLTGFDDFAQCKADARGLHEVSFRYDDEQEFVARALEQSRAIKLCEGTRVFDIPVILSALFDGEGVLKGIRIVTDPRGAEPADRADDWALGTMLRRRFGDEWQCKELPSGPGETPVASFPVRDECSRSVDGAELTVRREYYHRRGQAFRNEYGDVQPGLFISETRFEMMQLE